MGAEVSAVAKKAVVQCQGNKDNCKPSYDYKGIQSCAAPQPSTAGQGLLLCLHRPGRLRQGL